MLEAAQRRRKVSAPLRLAAAALYSLLAAPGLGEQKRAVVGCQTAFVGGLWARISCAVEAHPRVWPFPAKDDLQAVFNLGTS